MAIYKYINGVAELFADLSGGSSVVTPQSIYVSTAPTKVNYTVGDSLDLTGMVVKCRWSDGTETDVTSSVTTSPASGATLTASDSSVAITYTYTGASSTSTFTTSQAIVVAEQGATVTGIYISTPPTKTSYTAGEALSLTGMVVKATWSDSTETDITSQITTMPASGTALTTDDSYFTVSWEYDSSTYTARQTITVAEAATPTGIYIATAPTTTSYTEGDSLDLTGMVVKAQWSDSTETTVTSSCTTSPANGATLSTSNTSVTVSWTYSGTTYTATQAITVMAAGTIYGVKWSGAGTTLTRTDGAELFSDPIAAVGGGTGSSPFDNILPWSGMRKTSVTFNGVSNVMVAIPKYYYKWEKDGDEVSLQISASEISGFNVSPAHADRGDGNGERDVVYCARYLGLDNSATGVTTDYGSVFNYSSASGAYIWDLPMFMTVFMLALVEYADWTLDEKIGTGVDNGSQTSSVVTSKTGTTDSMTYHTGTMASSRTTAGRIQYRYIEDLWGNVPTWLYGLYINIAKVYCSNAYYNNKTDLQKIEDPSTYGAFEYPTLIGSGDWTSSSLSGYMTDIAISSVLGYEYAIYAASKGTKADSNGIYMSLSGGAAGVVRIGGFGEMRIESATSGNNDYMRAGYRLMVLP